MNKNGVLFFELFPKSVAQHSGLGAEYQVVGGFQPLQHVVVE